MLKLQFTPWVWFITAFLVYVIPTTLIFFLLLRPLFSEADHVREDSLAAEEFLILRNIATQLGQFKRQISTRNELVAMQVSLDSVAFRTNVKVIDVKADTTIEPLNSGFIFRRYMLTVEGHYNPLNGFIKGLEQTHNYYMISNLTIARIDDRTGKAQGQLTLRVLTVPE